jgi:recombinational DNA repair protein (RecF pathway)
MSYKTYTTEALVCGSKNHNTSDKNYLLFSREAGMVWATAKSVREERSKQRYALQDFSHIRVSLVRGKSGWRIGSVESLGNPFMKAKTRRERGIIKFVISELRRYVQGEIPLLRVYDDAFEVLSLASTVKEGDTHLQDMFLVRLLTELGYVAPDPSWIPVVTVPTIKDAQKVYVESMYPNIARAIEEGVQASHL